MSGCIGMTYAQLEALITVIGVDHPEAEDISVEAMIAAGVVKKCSKHPDYYISKMWQRRRSAHGNE